MYWRICLLSHRIVRYQTIINANDALTQKIAKKKCGAKCAHFTEHHALWWTLYQKCHFSKSSSPELCTNSILLYKLIYIYIYIYISGSQALTALSLPQILLQYFDIQRIVHRDVYTYNKTNEIHEVLKFISGIELYMFRTVLLSIIRNLVLYTQQ